MKLIIATFFLATLTCATAQDFKKDLATAKASYSSGKLEDAHFALQQMLQELDITIGKEVIKLLPAKMLTLQQNPKDDQVTANISFVGASIHRSYGANGKTAQLELITNSPLISSLNAFLTSPLLAGLGSNGNSKVIKVQGYKARLTKEEGEAGKTDYRLELPYSNALLTFNVTNTTDTDIIAMANTLPLEKIGKLIQ